MALKPIIQRKITLQKVGQIVSYLKPKKTYLLAEAAKENRKGERNYLFNWFKKTKELRHDDWHLHQSYP